MKAFIGGLVVGLAIVTQGSALGQQFPNRPIRLMLGVAAGGTSDIGVRRLAERLQVRLGQPVIVENRPGANTGIAGQAVSLADPDGHTLWAASSSGSTLKIFAKDVSLDFQRDFVPIGKYSQASGMLLTNARVPAKNMQEFIAYAKANPGKVAYGTAGGTVWFAFEAMKQEMGLDMLHVQYKGASEYAVALLADQVQLILDNPSTQQGNVDSGKVRYLAAAGGTRMVAFPNVPTVSESGVPGWEYVIWSGLLAPAKTPRAIVERLVRETMAVATSQEFKEDTLKWSKGGVEAAWAGPDELAAAIDKETKRYAEIARILKFQ